MKIFTRTDGIDTLYIQKKDILYLLNSDNYFPVSIEINYEKYRFDDSNLNEFIRVTDPIEIGYFYTLYYICNLNKVMNYSYDDLNKYDEKFRKKYKKIFYLYTKARISKDEKKINDVKNRFDNFKYMVEDYQQCKNVLSTLEINIIPIIPNELNSELDICKNTDYIARYGLVNNIITISRRDGGTIDYNDEELDVLIEVIKDFFACVYYDFNYKFINNDNQCTMILKISKRDVLNNNSNEIIRRLKRSF